MTGYRLSKIYEILREIGLVRSKRDFARRWLGHGKTYLRDYEFKLGRNVLCVPVGTVEKLRARIVALAARVPARIAHDLNEIIRDIDRDSRVANMLCR